MQFATETALVPSDSPIFPLPSTARSAVTPSTTEIQDHPPQRRGRRLRAGQDLDRDDQGVPRRERRHRRGFGARARAGRRG